MRFPVVPCDTSSPTPGQRWPPTVPRRPCARAGYEMQTKSVPTSAPGDRAPTSEEPAPIKMTNQQLDTPVHDCHCTLSFVIYFRPALHEKLRPGQGKCDPSTPVSRCSVCIAPETRVPKPCIPDPGRGLNRLRAGVRIRVRVRVGVRVSQP